MTAAVSPSREVWKALGVALLVTVIVGVGAKVVPKTHVATFVGFAFLGAVWWLVWRKDDATVEHHGLALGGVLLSPRIDPARAAKAALGALAWALGLSAIVFLPYFIGWRMWFHPSLGFRIWIDARDLASDVLGQLLLIALPEEAFYRGYLQTSLDDAWPWRAPILGARVGPALLVTSLVFAIGHVVTIPAPARLAVFFPALLFGWLRARTGGIGAGVAFHALCNVFSELLGRGYGVY